MNWSSFFGDSSKNDIQAFMDSSTPLKRFLDEDHEVEKQVFNSCLLALGVKEDFDDVFPTFDKERKEIQTACSGELQDYGIRDSVMIDIKPKVENKDLHKEKEQIAYPTHFEKLRDRRNEDYYQGKSDDEFFEELRVTRTTFGQILSYLKQNEYFQKDYWGGNFAVKAETALEIFLNYTGKRITFKEISDKYCISESAIMTSFARCVSVLNEIENIEIVWPSESYEFDAIQEGFEQKGKLKGVIGSMGTCCIEMRTSKEPPAGYKIGRQQSIMYLLAVANADLKFTYVHAGFPATFTSEEAFESSELGQCVDDPDTKLFPSPNLYMIASEEFSLRKRLIVPFLEPLNDDQRLFNEKINQTNCINKAFILFKSRFRVFQNQVCSSLEKIPNIIKACCVIHNIALNDSFDQEYMKPYLISRLADYSQYVDDSDFEHPFPTTEACLARERLANL